MDDHGQEIFQPQFPPHKKRRNQPSPCGKLLKSPPPPQHLGSRRASSALSLGSVAFALASLAQLASATESYYQVNWYSDSNCQDYVASCQADSVGRGAVSGFCGVSNTVQSYIPLQQDDNGEFSSVDSTNVGEGKDNCQQTDSNPVFLGDKSTCYTLPGAYDGACLNWVCSDCAE